MTEKKMKILAVHGGTPSTIIGFVKVMRRLGMNVLEYDVAMSTNEVSGKLVYELSAYIKEKGVTHLFSVHLLLSAAIAAHDADVKYICYIWDAPYSKVYSPYGRLENCWFITFDRLDCERWKEAGISHALYQPLAIDAENFRRWNRERIRRYGDRRYLHDISFVGQMYDHNLYDRNLDKIPLSLQAYFESIFEEAAFKWDGVNRVYGKTSRELIDYIKLNSSEFQIPNISDMDDLTYFEQNFLVRKIANIERIAVLNTLAEEHNVTLYTRNGTDCSMLGKVKVMPPVDAGEAACMVYAGSRINLHIALKGIEGGTSQRVMEVMAAGGFMMSTYCAETAEIFEEDKEIVLFRTPEELFDKVDYYLQHEKERREIARKGQEKVLSCYNLERKFKQLFDWVEGMPQQG